MTTFVNCMNPVSIKYGKGKYEQLIETKFRRTQAN